MFFHYRCKKLAKKLCGINILLFVYCLFIVELSHVFYWSEIVPMKSHQGLDCAQTQDLCDNN
jgi:hypothetical protein